MSEQCGNEGEPAGDDGGGEQEDDQPLDGDELGARIMARQRKAGEHAVNEVGAIWALDCARFMPRSARFSRETRRDESREAATKC